MTQTVIALDVGGTGIKCALVGADGDALHTVLHAERHPTRPERGPEAVIATILGIAEGLAATARAKGLEPVGAGLVVPGVIDEANGVAVWAANVGFRRKSRSVYVASCHIASSEGQSQTARDSSRINVSLPITRLT